MNSGASGTDLTNPYIVSNTDLINGLAPSASSGTFTQENAAGISVLTNGSFGTITRSPADPAAPASGTATQTARNASLATGGNDAGTSLTYTLPVGNGLGYNITSITSYGGWQDAGRDQQSYSVLYSTVAAPTTFLPLATVDFNPTTPPALTPSASRVILTNDGVTPNPATSVAAIRFNFNTTENGYSGYTEFDVVGTQVPEPTSVGAIGLAVVGLLSRRRRLA
jgi:hypothetical protein